MADVRRRMVIKELPDGRRRITHPSGLVVIETVQQRRAYRAELVEAVREAKAQLTEFDVRNPTVKDQAIEGEINGR